MITRKHLYEAIDAVTRINGLLSINSPVASTAYFALELKTTGDELVVEFLGIDIYDSEKDGLIDDIDSHLRIIINRELEEIKQYPLL